MKVYEGVEKLASPMFSSVVTLGNFDGVHLGHQALIHRTVKRARQLGVGSVAYTFAPHPAVVLRPDVVAYQPLFSRSQQIEFIGELGIEVLVIQPFTMSLAQLGGREFLQQMVIPWLHPTTLVVGHDFALGRQRQGTLDQLRVWGRDLHFDLEVMEPVMVDGVRVASRLIREALAKGQIKLVNQWLGRPYSINGTVVSGYGRGRKIGVPTANLKVEGRCLPGAGVYLTRAEVKNSVNQDDLRDCLSVTSVGYAPTFGGIRRPVGVECHILDQKIDLYGSEISLKFLDFIREERTFSSVDQLVSQIQMDIEEARRREKT